MEQSYIVVREMTPNDAETVNKLSKQLGYPLSLGQTLQNINAVLRRRDHTAFVAEYENRIIGWIGAAQAIMIEVMPHCEINGLVIDEHCRGIGIGRVLIEKLKGWEKARGNGKIVLHCKVKRRDAHSFYRHLDFIEARQQTNFTTIFKDHKRTQPFL